MNNIEAIGDREREVLRAVRDGLSVTAVLNVNEVAAAQIQARLVELGLIASDGKGAELTTEGLRALATN